VAFGSGVAWLAEVVPLVANVGYSGASRRLLPPTQQERGHAAIAEELVLDGWQVAGPFHLVSCPISCHTSANSDISYSKVNKTTEDIVELLDGYIISTVLGTALELGI
jgi:hypothetical protein